MLSRAYLLTKFTRTLLNKMHQRKDPITITNGLVDTGNNHYNLRFKFLNLSTTYGQPTLVRKRRSARCCTVPPVFSPNAPRAWWMSLVHKSENYLPPIKGMHCTHKKSANYYYDNHTQYSDPKACSSLSRSLHSSSSSSLLFLLFPISIY